MSQIPADLKVSPSSLISWGKEALVTESQALIESGERLGDSFARAVASIVTCEGKVVVTGLGKSGHICRKIASTLSSTGTSAFFLHPTEALHGDFGMISTRDCLLAVAYGGETSEVVEVAKYASRLGIPIIVITGKKDSTLAKLAHCFLDGGVTREACPHNLAPTSSSTVAMALGDALAVALMRARGFTQNDFAALHPGGTLGKRLSLVRDHLRSDQEFAKIGERDSFETLLAAVTKNGFGIAAVTDGKGKLLGAVTDGDLRRALVKHGAATLELKAVDIMTKTPKTIDTSALAIEAFKNMEQKKITQLFVLDKANDNQLVGLVRLHDLLAAKII